MEPKSIANMSEGLLKIPDRNQTSSIPVFQQREKSKPLDRIRETGDQKNPKHGLNWRENMENNS